MDRRIFGLLVVVDARRRGACRLGRSRRRAAAAARRRHRVPSRGQARGRRCLRRRVRLSAHGRSLHRARRRRCSRCATSSRARCRSRSTSWARAAPTRRAASPKKAARCPADTVAAPYAKAHHLGAEYLRVGRELTRHYDQVKEFDRLGESIGLTPDYRWKVKRVLQQYATLLTDYREMKVAFHDQLVDELQVRRLRPAGAADQGRSAGASRSADESWPQPGQPGAPGVQVAKNEPRRTRRCRRICRARSVPPPHADPIPKQHGAGRSDGERDALGRAVLRRQHQVPARRDRVRRRQEARRGAGGDARRLPGGARTARSLSRSTGRRRNAARRGRCGARTCTRAGPSRCAASDLRDGAAPQA